MMERDGWRRVGLSAIVAGTIGCGGDGPATPDADVDAIIHEPEVCDYQFGETVVLNRLVMPPEGPGNAMGFLAELASQGWEEAIENESSIYLFDMFGILPGDRREPRIVFYHGVKPQGSPPRDYVVLTAQFDTDCAPTSALDEVWFDDGTWRARSQRFAFVLPMAGTIEFTDWELDIQVDAGADPPFNGEGRGVWTLCGLSNSLFPGSTTGTFLDMIVDVFRRDPDVDRDGDGLERVERDPETGGFRCFDGDGTPVDGPECYCDPRIVDGFSVTMHGEGVPARIVGTTD